MLSLTLRCRYLRASKHTFFNNTHAMRQQLCLFSCSYELLCIGVCEVTLRSTFHSPAVGPHCHTHLKNAQRCKFVQTIYLNCWLFMCLLSLRSRLLFLQLSLNNYLGEIRRRQLNCSFLSYHCAGHLNHGIQSSPAH